jgi:hypothetical protein
MSGVFLVARETDASELAKDGGGNTGGFHADPLGLQDAELLAHDWCSAVTGAQRPPPLARTVVRGHERRPRDVETAL